MRSVRRVGEAGTHPTSTDHVSGSIQTASNGETVSKNQVNSLYMYVHVYNDTELKSTKTLTDILKALKTFSTNLFKLTAVPLSSYYYNKLIIIWASYGLRLHYEEKIF